MFRSFYTLPNLLSLFRIAVLPLLALCFYVGGEIAPWIATWLFVAACVTDFFDGLTARILGQTSALGKFLDHAADKVLVGGVILLLVAFDRLTGVWILAALIIFAREILISGLREFMAGRDAGVAVSWLGKWKAAVQMTAIAFLIPGDLAEATVPHAGVIGHTLFLAAAVMTVISGWDYLRGALKGLVESQGSDQRS